VSIAAPVALPAALAPELLDEVVVAADEEAVAGWTAGVCAWNASTPAVPAIVAVMTMGERRIRS
jgi:hypothetical protein